jgi:uncharacterized protein (DUF1501 family)
MKRRDFIKHLPIGVAAAAVPFAIPGLSGLAFGKDSKLGKLLTPMSDNDRVLVLINLQGGNDGLNTIIPFDDPKYISNRKTIGFTTADDLSKINNLKLRGDLAFNNNFQFTDLSGRQSNLYKMWQDGKLAVMQNVGYADPNRSHFRATDIWNSASDSGIITSTGWLGRYLEEIEPNYPFDVKTGDDPLAMAISFTTTLVFQGSKSTMGVAIADPSSYNAASTYNDDPPPSNNYGNELGYVRNILVQSDVYGDRLKALFPSGTPPTNNVAYPAANTLAQQLKKVAWCISKGMKTKVYFVQQQGFDTHVNQNSKDNQTGQGKLLFELAEAISLFQEDLEKFGVADRVVGMTYSEFGRRVNENSSSGTDHGTCAPQFIFGTQVNGELYGNHPDLVNLDPYQDLVNQFDFRQVYAGVLTEWFGPSEALSKAVLNKPEFTKQDSFGFEFPINGQTKSQSLFKQSAGVPNSNSEDRIFILKQNYPNPAISETTIAFALSEAADVKLEVFDNRGDLIATPVNSRLGRGEHPISFDARSLSSGTYYYRLDVNGAVETKSMKVVR